MKKVAIIGGGAAGIFSAITIKRNLQDNVEVTLIEKQSRIGKKILMTGNGKCNLSNTNLDSKFYNTDIITEALKKFDSNKCIEFFEELGLIVRVDDEGRVYPYSEKATTVLDVMTNQLKKLGVKLLIDYDVMDIKKTDKFLVYSRDLRVYNYDYLIMATGGASSITFDNNGHTLLSRLGHTSTNLKPGLVALKTEQNLKHLAGLRVKAKASIYIGKRLLHQTQGEVLFKNQGLSGICIFEISRFYQPGCVVEIDLIPDKTQDELTLLFKGKQTDDVLLGMFPKMINHEIKQRAQGNTSSIIKTIKYFRFNIVGTYGFENAQITVGGVSFNEVSPIDFSSLIVENLYIVGEVLDYDGACGGYNLHFAWASGYIAGMDIVGKIESRDNNEFAK